MTLIIKSNSITSPNSMAAIDMAAATADAAIVGLPGLKAWYRPDYGVSLAAAPADPSLGWQGQGNQCRWLDMVNQYPMVPISDTGPMLVTTPRTITGAVWAGGNITFTLASNAAEGVGRVVTVAGVTPTTYNGTYTTLAGTTGNTIVVARADPGAYTSGGTMSTLQNGKPYLRFNPVGRNGRMVNGPAPSGFYPSEINRNLWPASASCTIVYVARDQGVGANTDFVGTDQATLPARIQHASTGAVRVQHQNANLFTGSVPGDTIPHYGIYSYNFTDKTYAFRVNRASVATGTAAVEVLTASFTLGAAATSGSFRGDLYEVMCFTTPLHATANAASLATLESYLNARYGV